MMQLSTAKEMMRSKVETNLTAIDRLAKSFSSLQEVGAEIVFIESTFIYVKNFENFATNFSEGTLQDLIDLGWEYSEEDDSIFLDFETFQ